MKIINRFKQWITDVRRDYWYVSAKADSETDCDPVSEKQKTDKEPPACLAQIKDRLAPLKVKIVAVLNNIRTRITRRKIAAVAAVLMLVIALIEVAHLLKVAVTDRNAYTVEIGIYKTLRNPYVKPDSIPVKTGDIILMEGDGMVWIKSPIVGPDYRNVTEFIGFEIPGMDGAYEAASPAKPTEFEVPTDGTLRFFIKDPRTIPVPAKFGSGQYEIADGIEKFTFGPAVLKVNVLKKVTGKGLPPRRVKNLVETVSPDWKVIGERIEQVRKDAHAWWAEKNSDAKIELVKNKERKAARSAVEVIKREWNEWFHTPAREMPPQDTGGQS